MAAKTPGSEEIAAMAAALRSRQFPRLVVFADTVGRYVDSRLQSRASWLEINLVSFLILRGGTLTASKLANEMLRSKHSMTRLIDSLEEQGLVIRDRTASDRRTIQVRVTCRGLALLDEFLKEIDMFEERVMSRLDDSERQALMQIVKKLGQLIREEASDGANSRQVEPRASTRGNHANHKSPVSSSQ